MSLKDQPEAIAPEAIRDTFLQALSGLSAYWSSLPGKTARERTDGMLHSMLCVIDGVSGGFPCSLDLVCRPHPDDKAFHQDEGDGWVEDGTVLNASDMLHELFASRA